MTPGGLWTPNTSSGRPWNRSGSSPRHNTGYPVSSSSDANSARVASTRRPAWRSASSRVVPSRSTPGLCRLSLSGSMAASANGDTPTSSAGSYLNRPPGRSHLAAKSRTLARRAAQVPAPRRARHAAQVRRSARGSARIHYSAHARRRALRPAGARLVPP